MNRFFLQRHFLLHVIHKATNISNYINIKLNMVKIESKKKCLTNSYLDKYQHN